MFCVFTNDVTGSVWLSLAAIFIVLYIVGVAWLKLPSEICMALLIPFCIVGALITQQWISVIGALAFYFTFLIVKQIF
jgi:hypothetical protein